MNIRCLLWPTERKCSEEFIASSPLVLLFFFRKGVRPRPLHQNDAYGHIIIHLSQVTISTLASDVIGMLIKQNSLTTQTWVMRDESYTVWLN